MPLARTVAPRGGWQFTRPVVVISGRGGFSATETFVAAMRTLPQVTVIGDTTGGASGNPATFALGNGWQFTVPRWFEYGPDKQPIEWRGVAPHITIAWEPSAYDKTRDPLIDAAVGLLGERTGVYRMAPAMAPSSSPTEQTGKLRQ
jgi:C-terminal processing protease CtpA/Prc